MAHYELGAPVKRHGRLEDRDDISAAACEGLRRNGNVSLLGLGGSGKTALAAALVRDKAIRAASPDGWLWLNVGKSSTDQPTWRLQLLDWARAMAIPQDRVAAKAREGTVALRDLIHDKLGQGGALLIFDDVWKDDEALMFKNLGAQCIRLLTTSLHSVASKFSPNGVLEVGDLSPTGAETLFAQLAPTVLRWRPQAASQCLTEIGYLPLAVVMVASYLEARVIDDPTSLDSEIAKVLDVRSRYALPAEVTSLEFTTLPEGVPPTLRAVIDLSAESLAPADRISLASLAVFPPKPNSFSWGAADAVTESHKSVVAVRRVGLVQDDEDTQTQMRLTMHRAIRDYALDGSAGDADACRRMARYLIDYVSEAHRDVGVEEWLRSLQPETANIDAALTWLIENPQRDARLGLELMSALWDYWYRRSHYERANMLAHRLLSAESADSSREYRLLRAKVSNDAGNFAYNMADLGTAETLHKEAMRIRTDLADDTVAGSWNNLGLVFRERGDYPRAMQQFKAALERNRRGDNRNPLRLKWAGINLNNLGITAARTGDPDAENYLRAGVQAWTAADDRWGTTMAQIDLGIFLGEREEHDDEARALLVRALRERWEDKDEKLSASALRGLAVLALASDEGNRAKTLIDAASALSIPIRDRLGEWQSLILRARIDSSMQQFHDVARIAGILEVFGAHSGMVLPPRDEIAVQSAQIAARAVLGQEYEADVASGRASATPTNGQVDLEQAVTALVGTVDVEAVVAAAAPTAGGDTA